MANMSKADLLQRPVMTYNPCMLVCLVQFLNKALRPKKTSNSTATLTLYGAESMLSALLDIARLEGGTIQPKRQPYPLHDLLSDLELQFKSIAAQRNISLKVHDVSFWIDTDPQWIRRIIQTL